MKLNDIKDSIISKLQATLPSFNIIADEIPQGSISPTLILKLNSAVIQNQLYYNEKVVKVKIIYSGTYLEMRDLADTLLDLFGTVLVVGERAFTINNLNNEIIEADGGIYLQFNFDFSFIDGKEVLELTTAQGETRVMLPSEDLGYLDSNLSLIEDLELKELEE